MDSVAAHKVHFKIGQTEFSAERRAARAIQSKNTCDIFSRPRTSRPAMGKTGGPPRTQFRRWPRTPRAKQTALRRQQFRQTPSGPAANSNVDRVFKIDADGTISLRSLPPTASPEVDGMLLLLLGHLDLKNRKEVSPRLLRAAASSPASASEIA